MNVPEKINELLKNKEVLEALRSKNSTHLYSSSMDVGELCTYVMIHSSREDIPVEEVVAYLNKVRAINYEYKDEPDEKKYYLQEQGKSKLITKSIALALGYKDIENLTPQQKEEVKQYFLNNYVKNGYVFHSFPSARKDSVKENGFTTVEKLWDHKEVMEVAEIFKNHGVLSAVGGYAFYGSNKSGMYVEHDPKQMFFHSVSAPEWFKFFTSADHNNNDGMALNSSPYYYKDYEACRRNVEDLCKNTELTKEETEIVLNFFEKNWQKLGQKELVTSMIKRNKIGKDDISKAIIEGQNLEDTISTVLKDKTNQFGEHDGNVIDPTNLTGKDVEIVDLPPADELLGEIEFTRETRASLFDPRKVFGIQSRYFSSRTKTPLTYDQYKNAINTVEKVLLEEGKDLEIVDRCIKRLIEVVKESEYITEVEKQEKVELIKEFENRRLMENSNKNETLL